MVNTNIWEIYKVMEIDRQIYTWGFPNYGKYKHMENMQSEKNRQIYT